MIISASRRSDIPAFFGDQFYSSLIDGNFKIKNPFNQRISNLTFNLKDIEGIVFWSKNPKNFFKNLIEIKKLNIPFYFQFTLNNYPYEVEPEIPDLNQRVEILKKLGDLIYPSKIVWRYDPIILTKKFGVSFHLENFEMILDKIYNDIFEIKISFITLYRKIRKNFNDVIQDRDKEIELIGKLSAISDRYIKKIGICCYDLKVLPESKCVDSRLFGNTLFPKRDKGQRKWCNCDKSVDVGFYKSCGYRCLYCYAR